MKYILLAEPVRTRLVPLFFAILMEIIEKYCISTLKKGINIAFETNTEDKVIVCDTDQIERIMLNLLSNAIKFTDNGGSILVNVQDHGDKVEIIIKDTGIGIPPDKQKCIFDRFQRVESSPLNRHDYRLAAFFMPFFILFYSIELLSMLV